LDYILMMAAVRMVQDIPGTPWVATWVVELITICDTT